jgi:hypothetical protein
MTIERIQNRRGTTAAWGAANPVLFLGEFGVELTSSDDIKVKVGDGETSWDDLPYISSDVDLSAYYTSTQTNSAITAAITSAAATINTALSGKSNIDHTHTLDSLSDVASSTATSGQYLRFNGTSWEAGSADAPSLVSYDDLTDVPTEFTPEDHTHDLSDITEITATATEINLLDGVLATTTEINYLDGVTSNIQDQISGRAPLSHTHAIADTTGLQSALDGKAASSHTHTKSEITDFEHSHTTSDITGLQSALDGKAASSHTHTISDITNISSISINANAVTTTVSTSSSTSYSLSALDKNKIIRFTSSSAITFSITDVLSTGDSVVVLQDGTGQITFSGTGVSGAGTDTGVLKTRTRYSSATILKVATGEYRIFGDLAIV